MPKILFDRLKAGKMVAIRNYFAKYTDDQNAAKSNVKDTFRQAQSRQNDSNSQLVLDSAEKGSAAKSNVKDTFRQAQSRQNDSNSQLLYAKNFCHFYFKIQYSG